MERIAMSQEERDWLDWLKRARDGQVTQKSVAEKMGVSDRWVRRLLAAMKVKGDGVVVHSLRGRPSNRRIDEKIRKRAMEIVKSPDWHDFQADVRERAVSQAASDPSKQGDGAKVDDGRGGLAESGTQAGGGACLATAAEPLRRVGAVGHFRP